MVGGGCWMMMVCGDWRSFKTYVKPDGNQATEIRCVSIRCLRYFINQSITRAPSGLGEEVDDEEWNGLFMGKKRIIYSSFFRSLFWELQHFYGFYGFVFIISVIIDYLVDI